MRWYLTTLTVAGLALAGTVNAATIQPQTDVTLTLGPNFLLDDASTGGNDVTINEPAAANPQRDLALNVGPGGTQITITGIGWASSAATAANDATSVTTTITYLGAGGTFGGGDDVVIGTVTDAYPQPHPGAGEVVWLFDTPLVANIDGLGTKFRINITPTNGSGNGSLRFKSVNPGGIKLSVAGTSVPIPEPASLALLGAGGLMLLRRR